MRFSESYRDVRQLGLLSQSDFAKEIAVSYSMVNRWGTGKPLPTYKVMKSIESYYQENGISFDRLMELWKEEK